MSQVKQRYLNCMCIFFFLSSWLLECSVFNETFPQGKWCSPWTSQHARIVEPLSSDPLLSFEVWFFWSLECDYFKFELTGVNLVFSLKQLQTDQQVTPLVMLVACLIKTGRLPFFLILCTWHFSKNRGSLVCSQSCPQEWGLQMPTALWASFCSED